MIKKLNEIIHKNLYKEYKNIHFVTFRLFNNMDLRTKLDFYKLHDRNKEVYLYVKKNVEKNIANSLEYGGL